MNIMIADDSRSIRIIAKRFISALGDHQIFEAESGDQVFKILKEQNNEIDLILLDIHMPVMKGEQVLKLLKASPNTCEIKVVLCTCDLKKEKLADIPKIDELEFINKPFDKREFQNTIVEVLKA